MRTVRILIVGLPDRFKERRGHIEKRTQTNIISHTFSLFPNSFSQDWSCTLHFLGVIIPTTTNKSPSSLCFYLLFQIER